MRNVLSIIVALSLSCLLVQDVGSQTRSPNQKASRPPCGDPMVYSDFYLTLPRFAGATVLDVRDGQTLRVRLKDTSQVSIVIAGVDLGGGDATASARASEVLKRALMGSRVELLFYGYTFLEQDELTELEARVIIADNREDVGFTLLERGLVAYRKTSHLGSYERCTYASAVVNAKAARLGIWLR